MSIRIALFAGLILTLGTATSAVVSRGNDGAAATLANQETAAVEMLAMWTAAAAPPASLALSRPL